MSFVTLPTGENIKVIDNGDGTFSQEVSLSADSLAALETVSVLNPLTDAQLRASAITVLNSTSTITGTTSGTNNTGTVLATLDCTGLSSLSIQFDPMQSNGFISPQWSNNGTTWNSGTFTTPNGNYATYFYYYGQMFATTPVLGKYMRLYVTSTLSGSGSTTWVIQGATAPINAMNGTQSVNITSGSISSIGSTVATRPTPSSTVILNSSASTNATSVKASSANVFNMLCSNEGATDAYVKIYNKSSAPTVGTDTPALTIKIPAGSTFSPDFSSNGVLLSSGFALAVTGAMAQSDTTAVSLNQVKIISSYY